MRDCSACGAPLDDHNNGVELWGSRFCSTCFIGNSIKLHKELTEDDLILIRRIGKELSGFLPPELLEMLAVGFYRRVTGKNDVPPPGELSRFVGEIQRLAFFSYARKEMTLLKKWQDTFNEFVEDNEREIRENIKKMTDLDGE